jgi:hypothetical protein
MGLEPLPKIGLMADNAAAISNGFKESKSDNGVRGNCWFHVKKNVLIELASVKDQDKRADLLAGIHNLQLAQTPTIFKAASTLYVKTWSADRDPAVVYFINYFTKNWLEKNFNWFESYHHPNNAGSCSTNNGNESVNGVIKKQDTLRRLLPLATFLLVACNIVSLATTGG